MSIDVVFKWGIIKLLESSNTTFSGQLFDFYAALFRKMIEIEYKLWDPEANLVIPFICDKLGLPNSILKDKVKHLFRQLFLIYDNKLLIKHIFTYGVSSRNLKTVAETISELTEIVKYEGVDKFTEKDL